MPEKILIIAVKKQEQPVDHFQSTVDELVSLSHTAGGEVEEVVTQNRNHIHPATYIGRGKMNEITQIIEENDIDLVVSNDELSPGQIRNLSDVFGAQVIHRSQLILDIFAKRAHTKEGKLQVELAQLEYLLPRLHGQGTALSRLGGGIGTRGAGETKLETDRRHIRRKIHDNKGELQVELAQLEDPVARLHGQGTALSRVGGGIGTRGIGEPNWETDRSHTRRKIHDIKRQLSQVARSRDQYRKRRKESHVFQISI